MPAATGPRGNAIKAIVLSRYGSAADLTLEEIARPVPKDGQVLVKVHATSVNDIDWAFMRGKPHVYRLLFGVLKPKVAVLGAEIAGIVEAVGPGATRFQPGDQVYGDICEAGLGGFAEYVCVRDTALAHMPPGVSFHQAAALPHAGMLAWQGLVDVGRIREGERVLINGAGGGVGTLGVQIAKAYGCEVTGVDRDFKLPALESIGVDHVIDYRQVDFTEDGQRYDLILDARTTRSPLRYLRALNAGGRYVTVGGDLPRLLQILFLGPGIAKTTGKRVRIVALKPNKGLDHLHGLIESRGLRCVIDGPHGLADVPSALERFGAARHVGKIVIAVT
jgi:NADPH:quinone reductase-like Zn-dependent oxidoreductase